MTDRKWFRTTTDLIDAFGERMADGHNRQAELLRNDLIRHLLVARSELRQLAVPEDAPGGPKVVCLCGSTRFYDAFQRANYEETMQGHIVLSVGFYPHSQTRAHGEEVGCTDEQKRLLDELHLRKIDLADEILVLNVGGYVGESTAREIEYAMQKGKPIRFLETVRDALNRVDRLPGDPK